MKIGKVERILNSRAELGEGPLWDSKNNLLYWLDILSNHINIYDPKSGQNEAIKVGPLISCIGFAKQGGFIAGCKNGLATLSLNPVKLTVLHSPEPHLPENRMNDGKCTPEGRFIAGSLSPAGRDDSASLYSLSQDGSKLQTLLSGIRISNGLGWSPDNKTFYHTDTPTGKIMAYDYDLNTGLINNARVAVQIPAKMGHPDGFTVDAQGRIWVALWGGSAITVWQPETGRLLARIPVPAKHVSSCTFGGENLSDLYITSARMGLGRVHLAVRRSSGGLFRIRTDAQGLPAYQFG